MVELKDRQEFICKQIRDKNILDIGSCAGDKKKRLYNIYKSISKSITGFNNNRNI